MNALAQINPANARLPAAYEHAKQALAECVRIDECQEWTDKAAALASYAKQADDDEMLKQATRIKGRAIRRAGELLKQIEAAHGANQNIKDGDGLKVVTRTDMARETIETARKAVARSVGVAPGCIERLRNGRVKGIRNWLFERVRALVIREIEIEIQRLTHELEVDRQCGSHPSSFDVGEIEAHMSAVRTMIGAKK